MEIRPINQSEKQYLYRQDNKETGCIGYLRGDFSKTGKTFYSTWFDGNKDLKTKEFSEKFDEIINALRFDEQWGGLLRDRSSMAKYCGAYPDSKFEGNYCEEYGFRIDTKEYACFIRCNLNEGDYNFYCFCFVKPM